MIVSNNVELMHPRISVNAACFGTAPLPTAAGYWRELAPRRIGLVGPLPPGTHEVVEEGGYEVETIAHLLLAGHGEQLDPREEAWEAPRAGLSETIEAGRALGARTIYLVPGGHGLELRTFEQAAGVFCALIEPCVEQARAAGILPAVENALPLYADRHIAHSLRDAVTLAEQAGIGVCADLFACWTEAGLRRSLERAVELGCLIQLGDYVYGDRSMPCRAVFGDGVIPFRTLFSWILEAGYTGGFDLELLGPRIDAEGHVEAVRRSAENLGELLDSLGA
jgi:sugar phosphate isomerase/epimerase